MMMMMIMTGEVERREAGQRSLGNCCKKTSAERQSAPQVLVIMILITMVSIMIKQRCSTPQAWHCLGLFGISDAIKE